MKKIFYVLSPVPLIIFFLMGIGIIKFAGGEPISSSGGIIFAIILFLFDILLTIAGITLIIIAKSKQQPLKPLVIGTIVAILPILYLLSRA